MPDVSSFRRPERAKGEEEERRRDRHDNRSGHHDDQHGSKIPIHRVKLPRRFPSRLDAVIFDFDETMIDLEAQHTAAYEQLCRNMGDDYSRMPGSFRTGSGRRIIDDIREMRDFFGWEEPLHDLLAKRQQFFDEATRGSDLKLIPGVEKVARALHARGIPLAVTSSAVRKSIDEILRHFDIRDLFAVIVDGSEVKEGKPDPEAYLLTASKLEVKPENCVVFEDSTVGAEAARRAGMFCIAIRNPRAQMRQDLGAANVVLESFAELDLRPFLSR